MPFIIPFQHLNGQETCYPCAVVILLTVALFLQLSLLNCSVLNPEVTQRGMLYFRLNINYYVTNKVSEVGRALLRSDACYMSHFYHFS